MEEFRKIKPTKSVRGPIEEFIALPDAEKERIYNELDAMTSDQRRKEF